MNVDQRESGVNLGMAAPNDSPTIPVPTVMNNTGRWNSHLWEYKGLKTTSVDERNECYHARGLHAVCTRLTQ